MFSVLSLLFCNLLRHERLEWRSRDAQTGTDRTSKSISAALVSSCGSTSRRMTILMMMVMVCTCFLFSSLLSSSLLVLRLPFCFGIQCFSLLLSSCFHSLFSMTAASFAARLSSASHSMILLFQAASLSSRCCRQRNASAGLSCLPSSLSPSRLYLFHVGKKLQRKGFEKETSKGETVCQSANCLPSVELTCLPLSPLLSLQGASGD